MAAVGRVRYSRALSKPLQRSETKWLLALVERPTDWTPAAWDDIPIGAEFVGTEARNLTFHNARDMAFGFNGCSLRHGGSLWVVLMRDYGRTDGRTLHQSRLKVVS